MGLKRARGHKSGRIRRMSWSVVFFHRESLVLR
jgi:hypothetical protein